MDALEKSLTIRNAKGLHVRAATLFAQTAARYTSSITVEHDGEQVNAKSVMNLLLLTAGPGTTVRVTAVGEDASLALHALSELIESGFGE